MNERVDLSEAGLTPRSARPPSDATVEERLASLSRAYARFGGHAPERLLEPAWALLAPIALTDDPPSTPGALFRTADAAATALILARPGTAWAVRAGDLRLHIDYLADYAGVGREQVLSEGRLAVPPVALSDAIHNIGYAAAELSRLQGRWTSGAVEASTAADDTHRVQYVGRERLMVRVPFGRLVVPGWNLDVGVGIIRDGVIEPWTTAAVKALLRPGQTYVNVGANFGYYTVLGASLVERAGRVVSVEANPHLLPDLMRSVYASGYPDLVRFHQCAVSDVGGRTVRLTFDPQFIGGGSIQRNDEPCAPSVDDCFWDAEKVGRMKTARHQIIKWRGFYTAVEVVTETLDALLSDVEAVHLLHMDIEGSEAAAVLGGREAIRRSQDLSIIMEWSPTYADRPENQARVRDMWAFLRSEGFSFYEIVPGVLADGATFPECRPLADLAALLDTGHGDLVCLKRAAADRLGLAAG